MARCDQNETNIQRSNLIELEFKEDLGAFGDARRFIVLDLRAVAGAAECSESFSGAQREVQRSPVHCCTVTHLHSAITQEEPVLLMPSLSQIKSLLLGGLRGIKYQNG